jgi:hypothetical protein
LGWQRKILLFWNHFRDINLGEDLLEQVRAGLVKDLKEQKPGSQVISF